MILSRTQIKAIKVCPDCNLSNCYHVEMLIETLEAAWDDTDRKEIELEKARREVELKLERAIGLLKTLVDETRARYSTATLAKARKYLQEVANNE